MPRGHTSLRYPRMTSEIKKDEKNQKKNKTKQKICECFKQTSARARSHNKCLQMIIYKAVDLTDDKMK